jgi:hypothetical protein
MPSHSEMPASPVFGVPQSDLPLANVDICPPSSEHLPATGSSAYQKAHDWPERSGVIWAAGFPEQRSRSLAAETLARLRLPGV